MKRFLMISVSLLLACSTAVADWNPGDPVKMLQPQLPDPQGWDVFADFAPDLGLYKVLADDWMCTETGPVSDVHLWGSWKGDDEGVINRIHLSIHKDVPVGADPDPEVTWSHPGELLWERDFFAGEFTIRDYLTGSQGWYNPNWDEVYPEDHSMCHQINIENIILDPFLQERGMIYWLDVTVDAMDPNFDTQWGWKTSLDHWNDDAVFSDYDISDPGAVPYWSELRDPITGESLDMAFVITPEPATLCLLALGGLCLLRRKR